MKKLLFSLISFVLLFSLLPPNAMTKAETKISDQESFLNAIKKSDSFKEYKKYLIGKEPTILNPVTDENNNHIGYIAQFEIDFEKDSKQKKDLLTFNSLLTYIIDFSEDEMLEGLLDYRNVVSEKKIYFNNFGTGETVTYDVSDIPELQEVVDNAQQEANSAVEKANIQLKSGTGDVSTQAAGEVCWLCSKYQSGGGDYSGACAAFVGAACRWGDKLPYGRVLCSAAIVIGCYVPKYTICVEGKWMTSCPM